MGKIPFGSSKVGTAVKGAIGTTTVAVPLLFAAMPAVAQGQQDAIQDLRDQIQELQSKVDTMDQKAAADQGDGMMIGGTKFDFSGYIKVDGIYDFNGDDGASLGPSDVELDSSTDPHFGATAKQTRLKLATTTPTAIGDIGGYVEMDMYGGGFDLDNNYRPRVRQAYITYGNWLVGKAWTTFSDFNYGTMLNFFGPQAQIFERQEQIRYTFKMAGDNTLDVALETPDGHSVATTASDPFATEETDEQFPDLAVRFSSTIGNLSYQVAAIGSYIEADTAFDADGGTTDEDSVFGYGLDAGASYALPTGTTLMVSANYGEGDGKYVYDPAGGPAAYIDDSGDLQAIERYGYIATISQELAPKWTTNLVWGQGFSEQYYDSPDVHDKSSTAAINLLYNPVDPLTLGIEYDRADYENQGGDSGNANWIQVSAIYDF